MGTAQNTDSMIAPSTTSDFLSIFSATNVSWLLYTRKGATKQILSVAFLFAKDFQMMTSRWQGAPCFRRYGRELVSKTKDFVSRNVGGLPEDESQIHQISYSNLYTLSVCYLYLSGFSEKKSSAATTTLKIIAVKNIT